MVTVCLCGRWDKSRTALWCSSFKCLIQLQISLQTTVLWSNFASWQGVKSWSAAPKGHRIKPCVNSALLTCLDTSLQLVWWRYARLIGPCCFSFGHIVKLQTALFSWISQSMCLARWAFGKFQFLVRLLPCEEMYSFTAWVNSEGLSRYLSPEVSEIEGAALLLQPGWFSFGHWVLDICDIANMLQWPSRVHSRPGQILK